MVRRSVELFRLQDEINRIFTEILTHLKAASREGTTWNPALDILETADDLVVLMEAPGLTERDITVRLSGRWLILEGEKPPVPHSRASRFLCLERAYGKFYKAVPIPEALDAHAGKAVLQNGLLRIVFPKVAERRTRTIPLKVERA